jgi:hypothetical protein
MNTITLVFIQQYSYFLDPRDPEDSLHQFTFTKTTSSLNAAHVR